MIVEADMPTLKLKGSGPSSSRMPVPLIVPQQVQYFEKEVTDTQEENCVD
ncbi:hypothetical protein N9L68_05560 [bacterium]|nr:hypothetical protein [bacterium]